MLTSQLLGYLVVLVGKVVMVDGPDIFRYESIDPEALADGWIVKFYPYDCHKHRNSLKGLYDGASDLPPELASVPVRFEGADGETANLTFWAGFVGIAQDTATLALRPEIGWFITRDKEEQK